MTTTWNTNKTFRIVKDTAETYGLRDEKTGQIEHDGFSSAAWVRKFYQTTFGWSETNRLLEGAR